MPNATSSVTRIVDALSIVKANPSAPRIVPAVDAMFRSLSEVAGPEWAGAYADISAAVTDPEFMKRFQEHSAVLHALTRDTCAITRFDASNKINVVPPEAWAEIDCRILPDRPSDAFVNELRKLIKDTGVEISVIMAFTPAVSSTESRLYHAIETVTSERHPASRVMPYVSTGFTDQSFHQGPRDRQLRLRPHHHAGLGVLQVSWQ